MKSDIIKISKGPQFRGGNAVLPFLILIVTCIITGYLINYEQFIFAALLVPVIIFMAFAILDIQGVEINKGQNKIRQYIIQPWGKTGEWKDYAGYTDIKVDYESYTVRTRAIYSNLTGSAKGGSTNEQEGRFVVVLEHSDKAKSILLNESAEYPEALKHAKVFANELSVKYDDVVAQRMQQNR